MLVELGVTEQRYRAVLEVLDEGAGVTDVARRYGVARQTVHGWLRRYVNQGGLTGLVDRSSRSQVCPHQMSAAELERGKIIAGTPGTPGSVRLRSIMDTGVFVGLHGATVMRQALPLGLVDELRVHVIPVLLGGGTPLFGPLDSSITLERTNALVTPAATHIMFRVIR